ncbi:MAG: creatininase family protein [Planctomycetes bacterium]|nr:creatininase family protein [Planctomycetota bacterium]
MDEWDVCATNLHRASQRRYEVAVLPTAAVEAHNRHLPEGQDVLHTTHIARRCCAEAWPRCESVLCLPTIPYGVDCNLLAYPVTIHVSQATLDAVVKDIIVSLGRHGIRKIVLLNGHGGNDFAPLIRQVQCDLDVFVFWCNWWTVGSDRYGEIFDRPDDHAGQMETSVALALFPERVELEAAGDGRPRPFGLEALRRGWVRTSRYFGALNANCACGDPTGASAERGRRYIDLVCQRITDFLVDLATCPIDGTFPLAPTGADDSGGPDD